MAIGSITVVRVETGPVSSTATARLVVELRYVAQRAMRVDPGAWVATSLTAGGGVGRPAPTHPAVEVRTLGPGETFSGWVAFDVATSPAETRLVYFGSDTTPQFVVALG
jgi:hypothetical protein